MRVWALLAIIVCAGCAATPPGEVDVVELERARFAAMVQQDVGALEPMLGEDLVYCHSHGVCEDRAQFLETIRSGRLRYRNIEVLELEARMLGCTAVINGVIGVDGLAGSQPVSLRLSFTDVYALREGRWQLIAWQSTRLP